ncbi:MAG: cyclic nucleotide-binding domain-containing protein, partial [Bacteroidota bacterium]
MKRIQVSKGEIIQTKGERDSKVYKVLSGLVRSYLIDEKGKEHIFMFAPEGWVIGDSVPPEKASELYIDAIEASILIQVEKH